jgi:hypothetical protein
MGREDPESSGDNLVRWLTPVGLACILAAVVGGGISAFGVEVPAVGSVPRQLILAAVGIALVAPGAWVEARRRRKVARRQLSATEREHVRAHIDLVAESVRQLLRAPTLHEYLIIEVDGVEGLYAQFAVAEKGLHGELMATDLLLPLHRPDRKQLQLLRQYGWKPPNEEVPNFYKTFDLSARHPSHVARETVDLLINVYDMQPDDPLHVRFGDDDDPEHGHLRHRHH